MLCNVNLNHNSRSISLKFKINSKIKANKKVLWNAACIVNQKFVKQMLRLSTTRKTEVWKSFLKYSCGFNSVFILNSNFSSFFIDNLYECCLIKFLLENV